MSELFKLNNLGDVFFAFKWQRFLRAVFQAALMAKVKSRIELWISRTLYSYSPTRRACGIDKDKNVFTIAPRDTRICAADSVVSEIRSPKCSLLQKKFRGCPRSGRRLSPWLFLQWLCWRWLDGFTGLVRSFWKSRFGASLEDHVSESSRWLILWRKAAHFFW